MTQLRMSSTFVSNYVEIPRADIVDYLTRKHLVFKELPDKISIMECPFCHPTHGKPDNLWKLAIFPRGGYLCLRCGAKGSWYDFKAKLGDLSPTHITRFDGSSSTSNYLEHLTANVNLPTVSQNEIAGWVEALPSHAEVVSYLTSVRKLSIDVLKLYKVGVCTQKFPVLATTSAVQDPTGTAKPNIEWKSKVCISFPWTRHASIGEGASPKNPTIYYDRVKLRALDDKSLQRILPKGGNWGFFGWHTVPPEAKEIVITEGEYDAMSVRMATGRPAISLPNGARSLPPALLPALERFQKIVLWMDNDQAGIEGGEAIVRKLGLGRCYLVRPPAELKPGYTEPPKDANDALRQGYDLEAMIAGAQLIHHKQVASFPQFRSEVRNMFFEPNAYQGVPLTGMPQLQALLKGHRRGELTIITGGTGVGKTTVLTQLSLEVATKGIPTLWGSFEIRNPRLVRTMMMQYADSLGVKLSPEEPQHFDLVADHFSRIPFHFMQFYGSSPIPEVLDAMDYAVYAHDVQHIILDNLQFMLSGQGKGTDKFEMQDRAIESFRQFASQKNVHITLVIHPRKESDNTSLGLSSVFGTAKATQEADNVLIIQTGLPRAVLKAIGIAESKRKKESAGRGDLSQFGGFDDPFTGEVINTFFRTLEVRKNRWDGDLGFVPMRFDKQSNRFFEISKEEIQLGLEAFIEKQKKIKQLELVRAMGSQQQKSAKSTLASPPAWGQQSPPSTGLGAPSPLPSQQMKAQDVKPVASLPQFQDYDDEDESNVSLAATTVRAPPTPDRKTLIQSPSIDIIME